MQVLTEMHSRGSGPIAHRPAKQSLQHRQHCSSPPESGPQTCVPVQHRVALVKIVKDAHCKSSPRCTVEDQGPLPTDQRSKACSTASTGRLHRNQVHRVVEQIKSDGSWTYCTLTLIASSHPNWKCCSRPIADRPPGPRLQHSQHWPSPPESGRQSGGADQIGRELDILHIDAHCKSSPRCTVEDQAHCHCAKVFETAAGSSLHVASTLAQSEWTSATRRRSRTSWTNAQP